MLAERNAPAVGIDMHQRGPGHGAGADPHTQAWAKAVCKFPPARGRLQRLKPALRHLQGFQGKSSGTQFRTQFTQSVNLWVPVEM